MIQVKDFNKRYPNANISAIEHTNLELGQTGLISFIGKSGSGKTTLLNAIGGLDKVDSGEISYDDIHFKKYNMHKIDKYRQLHIGYVFQNYLLLEDETVYNNLKIALDLIGICNHEEQEKRIKYVLEAVGMYKYRKKKANKLSGGQMQRVSIARALVKESKLIIADEPTGNLDSENSVEVMNILKKISEKTLVLLVTHNKELATFYSDRIIEIADGKIINDTTEILNDQGLNYNSENKIHLLDLKKKTLSSDETQITLYTDSHEAVNLQIICKNNTIYIDSDKNIQVLKQSNVKICNDHYTPITPSKMEEHSFDISWYNNNLKTNHFINGLANFKKAFFSFFHARKKAKAFHFIFFFIGIIIAFSVLEGTKYKSIDTSTYSNEDAYYLISNDEDYTYLKPTVNKETILMAINNDIIDNIYNYQSKFDVTVNYPFNSIRKCSLSLNSYNYPFSKVSKQGLLLGNAPKNSEVVIGKKAADYIISNMDSINNYQQIIGLNVGNFKISGISKADTNSTYFNAIYYYTETYNNAVIYTDGQIYNLDNIDFNYRLVSGREPITADEIIINDHRNNTLAINDEVSYTREGKKYKVVGFFDADKTNVDAITKANLENTILVEKEIIDAVNLAYQMPASEFDFTLTGGREIINDNEVLVPDFKSIKPDTTVFINEKFYTVVGTYHSNDNIEHSIFLTTNKEWNKFMLDEASNSYFSYTINNRDKLDALNLKAKKLFDYQYDYDVSASKEAHKISLVIITIFLIISIIYVYFSTRSKLISEIKEVGVYRSIGATRGQIYAKYLSDIIVNATLTSIIGYLLIIIIYLFINLNIAHITHTKPTIDFSAYLLGAIILYAINIFFGLLPVFMLMRKTPAEINSKYDI